MILGIDPGLRRIGIAVADEETWFARPLEVIDVLAVEPLARIARLAAERGVTLVVVGVAVGLSGRRGAAAHSHEEFASELRSALEVEVVEYDERLTTVVAERRLRDAGASSRSRKGLRDAVAAQVMLQGYLDSARRGGTWDSAT